MHPFLLSQYLERFNSERILRKREMVERNLSKIDEKGMLLEYSELDNALEYFQKYLPYVQIFYSTKSGWDLHILKHLVSKGINFDVSSAGEIESLKHLGVSGEKMILANPCKTPNTIGAMFREKVKWFTFDAEYELKKISDWMEKHPTSERPKTILRIQSASIDVEVDLNKKFGCPKEQAPKLIKLANDMGFETAGLSFHVGTQSRSPGNHKRAFQHALQIIDKVYEEYRIKLNIIDIGGGFPVDNLKHNGVDEMRSYFQELSDSLDEAHARGIQIFAEPGRFVAAPAGTAVSTIIGKTWRNNKLWYYLSDGRYGIYNLFSFHEHYGVFPVSKKYYEKENRTNLTECVIAGPTCDSCDVLLEDALLPEDLQVGDMVFSPDIGAYTMEIATRFNGFTIADVIAVE